MSVSITKSDFGRLPEGTAVDLYTLTADSGFSLSLTNYGGIITSVHAPDRNGALGEVTLARNTLEEYLAGHPYYGALVGRVCNRISGGGFTLDGTSYPLAQNAGSVHLHGGNRGFDAHRYEATTETGDGWARVTLSRRSPDGEEGYPGTLSVDYTVTVYDDDRFLLEFQAETDAPTVVNLTNHCYWNLSTEERIVNHVVRINADEVAETADEIPTGRLAPVAGSAFDFRTAKPVGRDIAALDTDAAGGYDHSFAVARWEPGPAMLREAAEVYAPDTGRVMTVRTSYPAVHFYSGNHLPGETGRAGEQLSGREALCLECQFFPDSPNRPEFPSIELRPGEIYRHVTEHRFTRRS